MTASTVAALVESRGSVLLAGSHDADEVVELARRSLRPHRLSVRRGEHLNVVYRRLPLSIGSIDRLSFDAPVVVTPAAPDEHTFVLTFPVAGRARFTYGRDSAVVQPGVPVVMSPYRDTVLDYGAGFDQVSLRLSRTRVEAAAAAVWPSTTIDAVEFELPFAADPAPLLRLVEAAAMMPDLPAATARSSVIRQLEDLIAETLLLSQRNTASIAATADAGAARRQVRVAMDYMLDRLAEPLTMGAVAAAVGVSTRSLQAGFVEVTGMPPTRWLRGRRLERAHRRLLDGDPAALTVAAVAAECGLYHLGDFSRRFKAEFGLSPSDVLRGRPE